MDIRHDWTTDEALALMTSPLAELCARAKTIHAAYADHDVQQCELLSIKTGGCAEDCGYCSQSAHFKTGLKADPLMDPETVIATAKRAKADGATRFCMGAAWRSVPQGPRFDSLLKMISGVAELGIEVCGTFGMADGEQLQAMRQAGLTAYNHNLDTSREHYSNVVTTRTYDERLDTIRAARQAGVQVCCGGIFGMGESLRDRAALLAELARFEPHPESVPLNLLVPIKGTPLENAPPVPFEEFLRAVATARVMMPRTRVRLSAGRNTLTEEQQLQCFEVGANSIFVGEKLLTAPNVPVKADQNLYARLVQESLASASPSK